MESGLVQTGIEDNAANREVIQVWIGHLDRSMAPERPTRRKRLRSNV